MRHILITTAAAVALAGAPGAAPKQPTGGAGREAVYFTITLQNGPAIQVQSLKWGDAQSASLGSWAKADGLDVSWDVPDSPGYAPGNTKYSEVKLTRAAPAGSGGGTAGRVTGIASDPAEPNARGGHSMLGASDRMAGGGAQTESAQATGKRTHMPMRERMYYDTPQGSGPGSLVLRGSVPGCAVGQRYAGAQFASGSKRYALEDVVIRDCAAGAAALSYKKVTVRGWDPEKKEE